MIKLLNHKKGNIETALEQLLHVLNHYDGESEYLKTYNELYINYIRNDFLTVKNEYKISRKSLNEIKRNHPLLYVLFMIFRGNTLQKGYKLEVLALLKKHPRYPYKSFITLFINKDLSHDEFKKGIAKGVKDKEVLTLLWVLKNNPSFMKKEYLDIVELLNKAGVTYATKLLLEESVKSGKDFKVINIYINMLLNIASKEIITNYLVYLSRLTTNPGLKIDLLKIGIELDFHQVLIPLSDAYLNANTMGKERYVEAYKYLVIAEFHKVFLAKEKLDAFYHIVKFID
ncbi:MAG: hypothetical protein RBS24_02950 [Bacilli bacterium]|nr:hypothetical protein [Bacilli bacterium]